MIYLRSRSTFHQCSHLPGVCPSVPSTIIMIGTSVVDYIHIQFWIILLSSVVPLSVSYLGYDSIRRVLAALTWTKLPLVPLPWSLRIYALAEVIFHFVVYVPLQRYLQRAAIHPPSTSREEREKLFALCNDSVADPEQYLSKWFMGAPITTIKREDLKGFFKWAFFNSDDIEMPGNEMELEGYCQRMEASLGRSIPPGRSGVRCLRTTLDTVPMSHRSLLWYGVSKVGPTPSSPTDTLIRPSSSSTI